MASKFTQKLEGQLPAEFIWKDKLVACVMADHPLKEGHVVVFPRQEVPHWIDLDEQSWLHLMTVCQVIGRALRVSFQSLRVGMSIIALQVPHVHVHLVPINDGSEMDFQKAEKNPQTEAIAAAAVKIRHALCILGATHAVDS